MTAPMTRRGLVGRAVAAGAGAALAGVPAVLASPVRPAGDPVVAFEAERRSLCRAAHDARNLADERLFTLPNDESQAFVRVGWHLTPDGHKVETIAWDEDGIVRHCDALRRSGALFGSQDAHIAKIDAVQETLMAEYRRRAETSQQAREAIGHPALDRVADDLETRWYAAEHRVCQTQATSVAGVMAQVELLRELEFPNVDDDTEFVDTIIAGLRALADREGRA